MTLNVKQILSLGIAVVFLGGTVFLLYGFFTGGAEQISPDAPPITQGSTTERANLLPYGSSLDFSAIEKYDDGAVQPFQYPAVNPGDVGVSAGDLVKSTAAE